MTTDPRRSSPRKAVHLPVSIARKQAALSADISAGGFQLETTHLLAPGTPVDGYVLHGAKELTWQGVVTWSKPGNPMTSVLHQVGVRFTKVSPGLRALLSMRTR